MFRVDEIEMLPHDKPVASRNGCFTSFERSRAEVDVNRQKLMDTGFRALHDIADTLGNEHRGLCRIDINDADQLLGAPARHTRNGFRIHGASDSHRIAFSLRSPIHLIWMKKLNGWFLYAEEAEPQWSIRIDDLISCRDTQSSVFQPINHAAVSFTQ